MEIIPGLGLRGGRWVPLRASYSEADKAYSEGPVVKAGELERDGARWIHLVDLDGAKAGRPRQLGLMRSVMSRVHCKVQVGGGFRTEVFIQEALRSGAARVVVGTRAIAEPMWLDDVLALHGNDTILVSIDCVAGIVAVEGWESRTSISPTEIGTRLRKQGVERIAYTDVSADPTQMEAPNFPAIEAMAAKSGLRLIVSGGIRKLEHLETLQQKLGDRLEGVIVSRGIGDETFELGKALSRFSS